MDSVTNTCWMEWNTLYVGSRFCGDYQGAAWLLL